MAPQYIIVPKPQYGFWHFALDVGLVFVTFGFWLIVIFIRELAKSLMRLIRGF